MGSDCISSWSLLIFLLFSKFYRRHYELVSKFSVGLKTLLHQGLSEPEFYGDLGYKFKQIVVMADFSDQFRKITVRYKRIGYNINIIYRLTQSRLITLLPSLIARRWFGLQTQWWPDIKLFILVGWGRSVFCLLLGQPGSTVGFLLLQCSSAPVVLFDTPGISRYRSQHVVSVKSSSLFHHSIYLWFICFPWWFIDGLENLHADRTTVCFEPWQKPRARLGSRKTGLSPPPQIF